MYDTGNAKDIKNFWGEKKPELKFLLLSILNSMVKKGLNVVKREIYSKLLWNRSTITNFPFFLVGVSNEKNNL